MLTAKKKIVKKDAGQQKDLPWYDWDNIQNTFEEHGKIIWGVLIGVVVLAGGWYFYQQGQEDENIEANRQLAAVSQVYQSGQYKMAIAGDPSRGLPGLEEIAYNYESTPAGQHAMLYLGNCYLYTQDYDKAIETFENASPGDPLLNAAKYAGLGAAYFNKENFEMAAETFEKAAKAYENDMVTAQRYLQAAKAYLKLGNVDKGKEMLLKVKEAKTTKYDRDLTRLSAQYDLDI